MVEEGIAQHLEAQAKARLEGSPGVAEEVACPCGCACGIEQALDRLIDKGAVDNGLDVHGRKHARGKAGIDNGGAREGTLSGRDLDKGEGMGIVERLRRLVDPRAGGGRNVPESSP